MMETKMVSMSETQIDYKAIKEAGEILRAGGLVAFPTETVYGLGGDALQSGASKKIYAAKGRPSDNPLIIHICKLEDMGYITEDIPEEAELLARAFWPGPLTMILKKSDAVPLETTGGLGTVAVRMPNHAVALELIRAAGGYVAAPSANTSGKPSPTLAEHVRDDLDGKIDMIVDGGAVGIGLESTIVDLTEDKPVILRPGYITKEMLEKVLDKEVAIDKALYGSKEPPKAPGMKYRHYAPQGELTIVSGKSERVIETIKALAAEKKLAGERIGIICTEETKHFYQADRIASVGYRRDEESAARCLYAVLREFDAKNITCIFSEAFSDTGIGQAVMNRLLKAAGHRVLEV